MTLDVAIAPMVDPDTPATALPIIGSVLPPPEQPTQDATFAPDHLTDMPTFTPTMRPTLYPTFAATQTLAPSPLPEPTQPVSGPLPPGN
jgi:hypothetical protein